MPAHGVIEKFSGRGEDFEAYIERLEFYFTANDLREITVTDTNQAAVLERKEKRKSILLSVIGHDTYALLRTLCAPEKPFDKTYEDITKILQEHYSPRPSVVVCRFKFHTRIRQSGETVATFMSELRKLADNCNFTTYLNDMLCDRLVCGISDERIQRILLTEKDLSLEKAYSICIAEETAARDTSVLQGEQVNKIKTQKRPFKAKSKPSPRESTLEEIEKHCFRCGATSHLAHRCKHLKTSCNYCKKIGHLAKMCLKRKARTEAHTVDAAEIEDEEVPVATIIEDCVYSTANTVQPITVPVVIEDAPPVKFQVDTGSGVSIMNQRQFHSICGDRPLEQAHLKLTAYSGDNIKVCGKAVVSVKIENQCVKLPLYVVEGNGVPLLGRHWLKSIQLPWKQMFEHVNKVNDVDEVDTLVSEFTELFRNATGKIENVFAKLDVPKDAKPTFCKSRVVPYAMKKKVQNELDKLENEGIIRKVATSDWAAPLVPVIKPSGKLRLCGDYKMTVNREINLDTYPLPLIDELFANLSGGIRFTKLDLSQAYHQLQLDEESKKFTTVNTPSGLYEYTRLPYGISSAVGIFQRTVENILKGIPGVCVYLDDILVTGSTTEQHLQNLSAVLSRLQECGITLRKEKCQFFLPEVEYLGFRVSKDGLKPTEAKVKAIKEAEAPKCLTELRSFIGIVNYYSRFQPNLAHKMAPLYELLKKSVPWKWTEHQQSAFDSIKTELSADVLLAHYNPEAELILTCDASPFGIGAVLQQRTQNGDVRPIAFVSRTLSKPEKNYAQIEREGLSIVFGAEKFRHYLLGRRFTLETDHKPLLTLFGEHRGIPQMASARIKRWSMKLSAFDYKIKYISSKDNYCADFLSRSPLPTTEECKHEDQVLSIEDDSIPITARAVASETARDKVLSQVKQLTLTGWPQFVKDDKLQPYFLRRAELTVEQDCVLWGNRVIIPSSLRSTLLLDLHSEHMGIVRMKAMARQYLWWPKLNSEIEDMARQCESCREQDPMPHKGTTASWDWPSGPWKRLHVDFAGPFMDKMFLVVVDAHSKWLEIFPMKTATSETTIVALRRLFSQFGLPEHIVSDNGTQFTSIQFKTFLRKNNIRHTCSAPGHPATNGTAERYVGYFKHQMKKMSDLSVSVEEKLARFLMNYRTTPHPATNAAPCVLLMKRQLRTRFSSVQPNLQLTKEVEVLEKNVHTPKFRVGDPVYVLNFSYGPRWKPGIVVEVLNRNYSVQVDGIVAKRHEDQLRPRSVLKVQNASAPVLPPAEGLRDQNAAPTPATPAPLPAIAPPDVSVPPSTPAAPTASTPDAPAPATAMERSSEQTGPTGVTPERRCCVSPRGNFEPRRNPVRDRKRPVRYRDD